MAKEVYLREASGVVREAGIFGTLMFGISNTAVGIGVMWVIMWALNMFPSSNMYVSIGLCTIMCLAGAIVWWALMATFPRSGGTYTFVSRTLPPWLGIAVSVSNMFVMLTWLAFFPAWMAHPGLSPLFYSLGMHDIANWLQTPIGYLVVGSIILWTALIPVITGIKRYIQVVTAFFFLGMLGMILTWIVIPWNHSAFVSAFNSYSAQFGGPTFSEVISIGAEEMGGLPIGWTWWDSLAATPLVAWALPYGYWAIVATGEFKKPRISSLVAQVGAVVVTGVCMLITAVQFYIAAGADFLRVLGTVSYMEEWVIPWAEEIPFNVFATLFTDNPIILFFTGTVIFWFLWAWTPVSYVAPSRALLAWGMDRIGPEWFADVSERFHTPIKVPLLYAIMGQILVAIYAYNPWFLGSFLPSMWQYILIFAVGGGVSALALVWAKRNRRFWEASPVYPRKWLVTICAVIWIASMIIWDYFLLTGPYEEFDIPTIAGMAVIFVGGVLWFYGWRWYRKRQGIDIDLAFKELPPE